jgi:agmatinase
MKKSFAVLGKEGNFLGIDAFCGWEESLVVVLPVPLESTTSYMKGTAEGPAALIEASHQVEFFDDELNTETYRRGIATLEPVRFKKDGLSEAVGQVEKRVRELLDENKRVAMIGGEHTVSVGAVRAYRKRFPDLTVLHLDAHADLRESYGGSPYSHACAMTRIRETCPFVSVGIRSLCREEANSIRRENLAVFDIHRMRRDGSWAEDSLSRLGGAVYITLDLDVLDPAVMPAVGTPEPGGMDWFQLIGYLRRVFREKVVVGFDMVELCPRPGAEHGVFAAAKLFYRMIGYWYALESRKGSE